MKATDRSHTRPVLVLGGTAEARQLATLLHAAHVDVISSLAGRVSKPRLPVGKVRVGGFGGPAGLASWLLEHEAAVVVDATHPFAKRISSSARQACSAAGVELVRLERPGWDETPGDRWHWVDDLEEAALLVPTLGRRVLLTSGRQGLAAFARIDEAWFLIRCVDPPTCPLPAKHQLLLDRGPYTLTGETRLMEQHGIDLLVTKNSGGAHTRPKLDAARERGAGVIIVRRPARTQTQTFHAAPEAFAYVQKLLQAG